MLDPNVKTDANEQAQESATLDQATGADAAQTAETETGGEAAEG